MSLIFTMLLRKELKKPPHKKTPEILQYSGSHYIFFIDPTPKRPGTYSLKKGIKII
jgi:hypothetical protein